MKINKLLIYLFIIINVCKTNNDGEKKEKKILSLDLDDFEELLNDDKIFTFLIVYTHWCHKSRLVLENVDKMSNLLKYDNNLKIAKINAAVNSGIIERLNVYSYPSLFMIKKNEIHKYKGTPSIKDTLLWIYKYLDDSVYIINNNNKLDMFLELEEYNNSILFFVSRKENNIKLVKELVDICTSTGKSFCFSIINPTIISYFENQIVSEKYHFNYEEVQNKDIYGILFKRDDFIQYFYLMDESLSLLYDSNYTSEEKKQKLSEWIEKKIEPLVIKFHEYYFPLFFSNNSVTFFILYKDINKLNKMDIIKCAKKYQNITFSICGSTEIYEKRLLNELLIENIKNPVMRITEFKNHNTIPYKYVPLNDNIEINEKNIDEFIKGYLTNKKYFYRKSERPLPDEFNNGYVKIIVADTYDEYVFDSNKNVVVLFYAPWCGHCYKFEPVYREIGKRLKLYGRKYKNYHNDIVISKIDAVNNEIYDVTIEGYPTILLYTKTNKKEPIKYSGPRTVEHIIFWICEKTNTDINIQELLTIDLDDEQLFEKYEEL
ncbi:protein disulfide isomerase [Plasmodium gonderi]|uniref:Protein disulfide isomerase n=1 Tax=Plasmodium gonderi TaxID=77519 RepID=A0A1Y1JIM3_PLAGO|nr:protein disulfide isomerase [Plasmodium gonderi]GAW82359.1 protein disulfide isomerase [Plasmodium gonderi]